jgi:NADPH:quinone reductase-like Zn-dependent oxidoreductase
MRQLVQDLRSGTVEVVEVPDPTPRPGHVVVRTSWSVISPGTEQAISRTAKRSLIGKARERPDQVRKVLDKAVSDGVGSARAAVKARLDDVMTPGYSSAGIVEAVGEHVIEMRAGDPVVCFGANVACHAERTLVPVPLCMPLPDGVDQRWGAFAALGAIAGHGLRIAEVQAGSVVAILGLGLIGQLAA